MLKPILSVALSLVVCSPAFAQTQKDVRAESKALAIQLRAIGEPRDGCSLGVITSGGGLVVRTVAATPLRPGDRLISLRGINLERRDGREVFQIIRDLGPNTTTRVDVERSGEKLDLILECSNSRPKMESLIKGLDLAAAGKFEECVSALQDQSELGSPGASVTAGCAIASKRVPATSQAQFAFVALKLGLEDARWMSSERERLLTALRSSERLIGQNMGPERYRELVDITTTWPGGEESFAASTPDWSLFRRNAETALRSRLIDPDSARIEWQYGFLNGFWKPFMGKQIDGYWTCGKINARNRMGGYTGSTDFVVVLDAAGSVKFTDTGDISNGPFDVVTAQCGKSVKLLPPAPVDLASQRALGSTGPSVADELKKLLELKNAGALTEAEFLVAKNRLLGQ